MLHARRQNLRLPRGGGGLVSFQLRQHGGQCLRPFRLVLEGDPLPGKQEAHEVGGGDRLDLLPQPIEGVAVDPRQQPPLAPLLFGFPRGEPPAQDEALCFERPERRLDRREAQAEGLGEAGLGDRAQPLQPPTHQLDQRLVGAPGPFRGAGRRLDGRFQGQVPINRPELGQALRRHPEGRPSAGTVQNRRPPVRRQLLEEGVPVQRLGAARFQQRLESGGQTPRAALGLGEEAQQHEGVVQLVGVFHLGPGLAAHPLQGRPVQRAHVGGGLGIEPAAADYGLGAPLLQGRIVQEGIGPGVENLLGQRRGLGQIPGDEPPLAPLDGGEQRLQPVDVHGLFQAVADGLVDQRMIRHLPVARDVLDAGQLIGKDHRHQVFRLEPQQRRGHLAPVAPAQHGQGAGRVPAPAGDEHRRRQHGLHQQLPHRLRLQVGEHRIQGETVGLAQGQHDGVLGGRRLKLEVELAAEALAQG